MPAKKKESTALVKGLKKKADDLTVYLEERKELFSELCSGVLNSSRLIHMAMACGRLNPDLLKCSPSSWVVALLDASFFGLEPNPQLGEAYLIPYKIKGVMTVQFMPGYKGLRRLAVESGAVASIRAYAVYEKDTFSLQPDREWEGKAPFTHSRWRTGDPKNTEGAGDLTDVYAVWKLPDGSREFLYMPRNGSQSIEYYRSRSRATKGPWTDKGTYPAMAKKTVIRRACDELPLSTGSRLGLAIKHEDEFETQDAPLHMFDYDEGSGAVEPQLAEEASEPQAPPPPQEGQLF